MRPVVAITEAVFKDPEEGTTATVERLVLAVSHHRASPGAVETLVLITALACHSNAVVSMTRPAADLDELETLGLVKWAARDKVVLL